jgi:hypothetical protein
VSVEVATAAIVDRVLFLVNHVAPSIVSDGSSGDTADQSSVRASFRWLQPRRWYLCGAGFTRIPADTHASLCVACFVEQMPGGDGVSTVEAGDSVVAEGGGEEGELESDPSSPPPVPKLLRGISSFTTESAASGASSRSVPAPFGEPTRLVCEAAWRDVFHVSNVVPSRVCD